jgi:hypothetical protein
MNVAELILYIGYSVVLLLLLVLNLNAGLKYRKLFKQNSQLTVDNIALMKQLYDLMEIKDSKTIEETDGFLKFVSESRDWAFQYIEDVQRAITEYREIADTVPVNKEMTIEQATKLSEAYDKLVSYLPKEESNV